MQAAIKDRIPAKIDIGPVYNVDPQRRAAYTGECVRQVAALSSQLRPAVCQAPHGLPLPGWPANTSLPCPRAPGPVTCMHELRTAPSRGWPPQGRAPGLRRWSASWCSTST